MANEPSKKIGSMDCLCCGEVMPVKQNGRDTLNVSCPWCGFSAYAKGGTESHGIISGFIRKDSEPEPAPAATKAPAPAPAAPAKTPATTIFG